MVLDHKKRFPKEHRLRKRWQFLTVQSQGQKVVSRFFIGLVMHVPGQQETQDHSRIGITTTGRYANAVVRNWTRRLVREAFRNGILSIPNGVDVVVIPKKHAQYEPSDSIFNDLATLGRRITRVAEKTKC